VVEEAVIMLCSRPVSSLVSSLYGMLAGAIVYRIWVRIERQDDALQASRAQRSWQQAAPVAAFQQVISGVGQAALLHRSVPRRGKLTGAGSAGGGQQVEQAARS
jgi:Protein of unknown function (DUF4235)